MPQEKRGRGQSTAAPPPPNVADKTLWVSRKHAARVLGIDQRGMPRLAAAAAVRVKKLPGLLLWRYYLPDVENVARRAVTSAPKTGTARPR